MSEARYSQHNRPPETDHKFEGSLFCDCDECNQMCHYHYGLPDVCLRERHEHANQMTLAERYGTITVK